MGSEDGTVLLKSDKRIELTGDQATREAQAEQLGIEVADELLITRRRLAFWPLYMPIKKINSC